MIVQLEGGPMAGSRIPTDTVQLSNGLFSPWVTIRLNALEDEGGLPVHVHYELREWDAERVFYCFVNIEFHVTPPRTKP